MDETIAFMAEQIALLGGQQSALQAVLYGIVLSVREDALLQQKIHESFERAYSTPLSASLSPQWLEGFEAMRGLFEEALQVPPSGYSAEPAPE